jgi:hypothetical protein
MLTNQLHMMLNEMQGSAIQVFTLGSVCVPFYINNFRSWFELRQGKKYLIFGDEEKEETIDIKIDDIQDCEINNLIEKEIILNLGKIDVQVCTV